MPTHNVASIEVYSRTIAIKNFTSSESFSVENYQAKSSTNRQLHLISIRNCQLTNEQLFDILRCHETNEFSLRLALHHVNLIDSNMHKISFRLPITQLYFENCTFNDEGLGILFRLFQSSPGSNKTLHIAEVNLEKTQIGLLLNVLHKTNLQSLILDTISSITFLDLYKLLKKRIQLNFLKLKGFKFIESEPTEFKAATASDPKSLETNPNNNETNQDLVVQTTTTNNNTDVKGSSSTDPNPIKIIAPGHSGLISITDCQMTETQLHDILQLYQNDPLPFELALHNVTLIDDQAPINTELKLPLIKLYCENCEFNDQALSFVFKLLQFSSCSSKTLHIANTNLSNEQIGLLLRTVNKTNQLRYLILDTMTNLTSAELSKIIKHGLQVEFLKLTGFDFTADKAIDLFAAIQSRPKSIEIDISDNEVTPSFIDKISIIIDKNKNISVKLPLTNALYKQRSYQTILTTLESRKKEPSLKKINEHFKQHRSDLLKQAQEITNTDMTNITELKTSENIPNFFVELLKIIGKNYQKNRTEKGRQLLIQICEQYWDWLTWYQNDACYEFKSYLQQTNNLITNFIYPLGLCSENLCRLINDHYWFIYRQITQTQIPNQTLDPIESFLNFHDQQFSDLENRLRLLDYFPRTTNEIYINQMIMTIYRNECLAILNYYRRKNPEGLVDEYCDKNGKKNSRLHEELKDAIINASDTHSISVKKSFFLKDTNLHEIINQIDAASIKIAFFAGKLRKKVVIVAEPNANTNTNTNTTSDPNQAKEKNTVKTRNQRNWEKLGGKTHELPPEFLFDQQLMDFPTIVTMKNNLAEVMEYASIPQNESIQSIELDFFKRVAIQKFLEEKYAAKVVTPNRSANKKKVNFSEIQDNAEKIGSSIFGAKK